MSERRISPFLTALAVCCLFAAVASCSTMGITEDKKGKEVLEKSVEAFNSAFRWEDYTSAAAWVPSGKKELFWNEVDNFKGKIKIFDVKIRDIDHVEESGAATAIVNLQYYRTNSPIVNTVNLSQKWFFSEKLKAWQLGHSDFQKITKTPSGL